MRHVGFDEFLALDDEALPLIKRHCMCLRMQYKLLVAILSRMFEQRDQHLLAYAFAAQ